MFKKIYVIYKKALNISPRVSKINIHVLSEGDNELSFKLKDFILPVTLTKEHIDILLKGDVNDDKVPFGMYC